MTEFEIIGLVSAIVTILSIVTWSKIHWFKAISLFIVLFTMYIILALAFNFWPFRTEATNYQRPEIEEYRVGDYYVGMPFEDAITATDNNHNLVGHYHSGTPESDDTPNIFIKDNEGNPELFINTNGKNVVSHVLILSNKYMTGNGVYTGMRIKDLLDKYSNMPLFSRGEMFGEEVFLPKSPRLSFVVSSDWFSTEYSEDDSVGKYERLSYADRKNRLEGYRYLLGDDIDELMNVTMNYNTRRKIIYISLGR